MSFPGVFSEGALKSPVQNVLCRVERTINSRRKDSKSPARIENDDCGGLELMFVLCYRVFDQL
jgi:hypothetical protein